MNGKETYIKKLTVNGQSKNPITYSTVVCSDQNVVIEYGVRAQTAKQNVDIQYYVDNVHVDTKSTTVIQGQTFQYTAESDYKGGQFKRYVVEIANKQTGSGTNTSISVSNVTSSVLIKLYYEKAVSKTCKVTIQSATGGTTM